MDVQLQAPHNRKRDIDNVLKAMLDAIQHSELIDDDNQFDELIVQRATVSPGHGAVELTIVELDVSPEPKAYPRNPDIPSGAAFRPWFRKLTGRSLAQAAS